MIIYTILGIGLCIFSCLLFLFLYDWYKDKEWRRNNPDEHEIMDRKIKDDFSK